MTIRDPQVVNRIPNIANGSITTAKLANGSITTDKISTLAQPGLVYITQASFYGVASYDFVSVFSSNFDAYRFIATDAYTSTSSIHVQFQMLSGTTPATTNYHTQRLYAQGSTVGTSGTGSGTAGQGSLCYLDNISEGGYYFDIFNPYLALKTNVISQAVYQYAGIEYHSSKHAVSSSYDGIRIKTGSGLMYGNIRVYGYRKGS